MKKSVFVLFITALFAMTSCQKSNTPISSNSNTSKSVPSMVTQSSPVVITIGIRLYRPKYDCKRKLSLCIGRKRHINLSLYQESELFLSDETVGDTSIRLGDAKISLNFDKTVMTVQFLNDFDKSDGTTFVIDDGYNVFDLDQGSLYSLGVQSITMQPGSYNLTNYDLSLNQFGILTIPVTTD